MSHSLAQALPGNFSGSRKRTHAEITRSESRSQSPQPPSKRRRTLIPGYRSSASSRRNAEVQTSQSSRFVGDGFDHRRPVMSSSNVPQPSVQDTIDLTLDEDSPPPRPLTNATVGSRSSEPALYGAHFRPTAQTTPLAPPFAHQFDPLQQQIIDLSSDDEDGMAAIEGGVSAASQSPEVQFIREQTAARPQPQTQNATNTTVNRSRLLPPPEPMRARNFGSMAELLRGMTQTMFGNLRGQHEPPEDALNRIDGILNPADMGRAGLGVALDPLDEYDIQMDYARPAFQIRGEFQIIEPPDRQPGPIQPTYKEPAPAQEGFTRTYEEDDMLICAYCNDELATGKTEQKQNVWIIKKCGHAYCGDCAQIRTANKSRNNKDSKKTASKKVNAFKVCAVPGCSSPVDGKKMFQIYL